MRLRFVMLVVQVSGSGNPRRHTKQHQGASKSQLIGGGSQMLSVLLSCIISNILGNRAKKRSYFSMIFCDCIKISIFYSLLGWSKLCICLHFVGPWAHSNRRVGQGFELLQKCCQNRSTALQCMVSLSQLLCCLHFKMYFRIII